MNCKVSSTVHEVAFFAAALLETRSYVHGGVFDGGSNSKVINFLKDTLVVGIYKKYKRIAFALSLSLLALSAISYINTHMFISIYIY